MQPERTALLLTAANTMSPQKRPRNWCPKIWIISSMAVSSSWPGIFTVSENIPSPSHDIYHHISSFKHLHFHLWVKGKSQLNDQPRERHLGRTVFLRLMISTVSGSFFLEDVSLSCFLYANLCRHIRWSFKKKINDRKLPWKDGFKNQLLERSAQVTGHPATKPPISWSLLGKHQMKVQFRIPDP